MVAITPLIATKSCRYDKKAWHNGQKLVANHGVSMCLQHVSWLCWCTGAWSTETGDGYGEGQVEIGRVDGQRAVKDGRDA
jgi:hypothetical protein